MKNNKVNKVDLLFIAIAIFITSTTVMMSQEAPTEGKKQLEVVEKWDGEYDAGMESFYAQNVKDVYLKKLPKKLEKYGFTNVVIIDLGKVVAPDNWATKLHKAQGGNQGAAMSNLSNATSVAGAVAAVELYNAPARTSYNQYTSTLYFRSRRVQSKNWTIC